MVKISISGLKEFEQRLKAAPEKIKRQADEVIQAGARRYAKKAKQSATSQFGDYGNLAGQIQPVRVAQMKAAVNSNAHYSAYLEWGTITRVSVPAELKDYAIQFKGRGIRKTGGLMPHPYFFIHQPQIQALLIEDLKQVLEGI